MKFEEVLPLMRKGAKARHQRMRTGEYWICGKASMSDIDQFHLLIKVFDNPFKTDKDNYSWGIERWAILCDDWEVIEDERT